MDRDKHLKWCKARALEYLEPGEYFSLDDAMASMISDLGKHEETRRDHQMTIDLMVQLRAALTCSIMDTPGSLRPRYYSLKGGRPQVRSES